MVGMSDSLSRYLPELRQMRCFSFVDIENIVGCRTKTKQLVDFSLAKSHITRVRPGFFAVNRLGTDQPEPNVYEVASKVVPGSYIAFHSAFGYHGLQNQVLSEMYVASKTRFSSFEYGNMCFRHFFSPFEDGVDVNEHNVRLTNLERTAIDCIDDFSKCFSLEELLRCLDIAPAFDYHRLERYLSLYNKGVLYKKVGYILEHFKNHLKIPDIFFDNCIEKMSGRCTYLYNRLKFSDTVVHDKKWNLYAPLDLLSIIDKGYFPDDPI